MKRAEITPLPWSIGDDSPTSVCAKPSWTERMVPVALVYDVNDHQHQTPVSIANAAYIVRACNNFPKLVEVLRMLREITGEDWKDLFIGNEPRGKLGVYLTYAQLESIHSVIAAAEGE